MPAILAGNPISGVSQLRCLGEGLEIGFDRECFGMCVAKVLADVSVELSLVPGIKASGLMYIVSPLLLMLQMKVGCSD